MRRAISTALVLAAAVSAVPRISPAAVEVERPAAQRAAPSPAARACDIRFRGDAMVANECDHGCYVEAWDGPVLMAANTCSFAISASYVFSGLDGRAWRTPCYALAPGATAVAIPEDSLGPWAERRVIVVQEPGTRGYRAAAPAAECPDGPQVQPSTTMP